MKHFIKKRLYKITALYRKCTKSQQKEIDKKHAEFYAKCAGCEYSVRHKYDNGKEVLIRLTGNCSPVINAKTGDIIRPCNHKPSRWRKS